MRLPTIPLDIILKAYLSRSIPVGHFLPTVGFAVTNFHFNIAIENNIDPAQHAVMASVKIIFMGDDKSTQLGTITTGVIFSLGNFEAAVALHDDNTADLIEPLADVLNSIALSTARGVMFTEFKGTFLHNAILPIIDVKSLKKQNAPNSNH